MIPNISQRTRNSPRFVSDTLCFYEGDTFNLQFLFELLRDEEEITIRPEDEVIFEFRRPNMLPVFVEKTFTGVSGNVITFEWNDEWTANFGRGYYEYRIKYRDANGFETTVVAYGSIAVE